MTNFILCFEENGLKEIYFLKVTPTNQISSSSRQFEDIYALMHMKHVEILNQSFFEAKVSLYTEIHILNIWDL